MFQFNLDACETDEERSQAAEANKQLHLIYEAGRNRNLQVLLSFLRVVLSKGNDYREPELLGALELALTPPRRGPSPEYQAAIARRNNTIRHLARKHYPVGSTRERARQISDDANDYETRRYRHDKNARRLPVDPRNVVFYNILEEFGELPGMESIKKIISKV